MSGKAPLATEPANTPRTRDRTGRWLKGTPSPNPTGRPATPAEVQAIWDAHTEEAALKIIDVMRTAPEVQDQLRAAMHVLDRRFGKPSQALDVTARAAAPGTVVGQPDAARRRLEEMIAAAEAAAAPALVAAEPPETNQQTVALEVTAQEGRAVAGGHVDAVASGLPDSTGEGTP